MSFSNYLETQIVTHLLRTGSWTKPSAIYVALFTSDPGEAGAGTEVSGGSYARVQVGPSDATWAAPTDGVSNNVSDITFPTPSANWGTVTHFALFDAASAGNMLMYGSLGSSAVINNGDDAPLFSATALTVTVA